MATSSEYSEFPDPLNDNSHHLPNRAPEQVNSFQNQSGQALLVGPSDRRHLGDQLRPHIFSRLLDVRSYRCAGLVSKDLTGIGGHDVLNFGEAALEKENDEQFHLVHTGGDALMTGLVSGYHQAAEDCEEHRFRSLIQIAAREEMLGYVKRRSGQQSPLAYVLAPKGSFSGAGISFFGLRLPEPSILEDEQEEHLVYCAGESSFVGVSGKSAEEFFSQRGITPQQIPCALSVLPRVCGKQLKRNFESSNAIKSLSDRFERGWIAVEVGDIPESQEVDFANAVSMFAATRGWGIAVYSANRLGDRANSFRSRWTRLLGKVGEAVWFDSTRIWDLTQLIANAKFFTGSCLDSRIIAGSFCVPRINTPRDDRRNIDYCESWEHEAIAPVLSESPDQWLADLDAAVAVDRSILEEHAASTSQSFFEALAEASRATALPNRAFAGEPVDHCEAVAYGKQLVRDWMDSQDDRENFAKLNRNCADASGELPQESRRAQ